MEKKEKLLDKLVRERHGLEERIAELAASLDGTVAEDMTALIADQLSAMRLCLSALGRRIALLKGAEKEGRKERCGCAIAMTEDEFSSFLAELGVRVVKDWKPEPFQWAEDPVPLTYTYTMTCRGL